MLSLKSGVVDSEPRSTFIHNLTSQQSVMLLWDNTSFAKNVLGANRSVDMPRDSEEGLSVARITSKHNSQDLANTSYRHIHNRVCTLAPQCPPVDILSIPDSNGYPSLSTFSLNTSFAIQHCNMRRFVNYVLDAAHGEGEIAYIVGR